MKIIFVAISAALLLVSPVFAETVPGKEANRILTNISDALASGKAKKPITRKVIAPIQQSPDLEFNKQSDLTSDLTDRYMSRAISHFLPWGDPGRSRGFLKNTGTKYIHWSHLLWGQPIPSWKKLCEETDAVHGSIWGADVVYEAGVMEIVSRPQVDLAPIPDWLYKCMDDLGINATRKPGPNGPRYFSYENMFDRNAKDWDKGLIGRWERDKDGKDVGSVPDITMPETQLWYAYLMTEYIDAGFEGIFFGQIGLTGARDKDNECTYEMAQFAKRVAAARAYRHAVFLSTHHYCVPYKDQPIYTHMTWPSRMFYSNKQPFGMETGLNATDDGQHRTAAELHMVIKKPPFDLPILIEIDNYGKMPPTSSIACDSEGNDEITAYMKKPPSDRAAFLRYYYHEFLTYTNKLGKVGRVHLAPSGERCGYMPYKELGGEEDVIKELFAEAAKKSTESFAKPTKPVAVEWQTYQDKKRNFSLLCPAVAVVADKSGAMKPKAPGSFWVAFTVKSQNKVSYVINVRHTNLAAETDPDIYTVKNPYLLSWERDAVNGMCAFKTTSKDAGNTVHRAVLLDGKSVWMLNLTDSSGGAPDITAQIFDCVMRSLNVDGLEPVGATR